MLAERSGTRDFAMMLANDELRVLLVSIHVPLQQAIASVTMDNELRAIRLAHQACRAFGIPGPGWPWQGSIRMPVKTVCSGTRTAR